VFLGLAGILVCSFLGGMRAVTWTQVAQYIILIVAYMIPVVWLSVKHTSVPLPQFVYGSVLQKVTEREKQLTADPKEKEVRDIFRQRAADAKARVDGLPATWTAGREAAEKKVAELKAANAPMAEQKAAEKALADYPKSEADARRLWTGQIASNNGRAAPPLPHGEPFYSSNPDPVKADAERDRKRKNFLALILCLMVGTAALPHILMRYYTTPSVQAARQSVFWSLFFIFLLYFTAPALAVLVKFDVFTQVVGKNFADLPGWVSAWAKIDPRLMSITDINKDGVVQLAEIVLGQDIIVLATPEIAGLPYVISGLVAAGGLAAALSTADGLLLTIANALSHDLYYKMINPNASTQKRILISKVLLLVVAGLAALTAAQAPADILFLVGAAFSLAAAGFFAPLALGVFWKRANKWGAITAMVLGVGITFYYMATTQPWLRGVFGVSGTIAENTWWDIAPISAGIFGMPVAMISLIVVSLLTPAPDKQTQDFVEHVRYPSIKGDTVSTMAH
jgi:cation/acetate symporter